LFNSIHRQNTGLKAQTLTGEKRKLGRSSRGPR
jgi:hypothetical protein